MTLKEQFIQASSLSDICIGREKLEMENLIGKTVTICDADPIYTTDKHYYVFTTRENKGKFSYGGYQFTRDFDKALATFYDGDIMRLREDLQKTGLKVKFGTLKLENGNNVTTLEYV